MTIEGLYTQRMFWLAATFTLVSVAGRPVGLSSCPESGAILGAGEAK
jgi:hypothetical protein